MVHDLQDDFITIHIFGNCFNKFILKAISDVNMLNSFNGVQEIQRLKTYWASRHSKGHFPYPRRDRTFVKVVPMRTVSSGDFM